MFLCRAGQRQKKKVSLGWDDAQSVWLILTYPSVIAEDEKVTSSPADRRLYC